MGGRGRGRLAARRDVQGQMVILKNATSCYQRSFCRVQMVIVNILKNAHLSLVVAYNHLSLSSNIITCRNCFHRRWHFSLYNKWRQWKFHQDCYISSLIFMLTFPFSSNLYCVNIFPVWDFAFSIFALLTAREGWLGWESEILRPIQEIKVKKNSLPTITTPRANILTITFLWNSLETKKFQRKRKWKSDVWVNA